MIVDTTCGFEIDITFPVNRESMRTAYDANGNEMMVHITGNLVVRFENPATGKAIQTTISGPTKIDDRRGTFQETGRTGFPVYVHSGRIDFVGGTTVGHDTDYCAALAA
jgi:hypothetical protein